MDLSVITVWLVLSFGHGNQIEKMSSVSECMNNVKGFQIYEKNRGSFEVPELWHAKCMVFRRGDYGNVEVQLIEN
ncbi:hypothetical protein AU106_gp163 [Sinorhizobium phage phiM9]|uniref:Uncharacterized protein n=1 Tax=Sinorhizobium phage phiM9 TaxID=1636182 RepID=A0A0F6THK2_9CAUD|nr:hypothetical protein AU106_gp163 [Sinorhizobium phage phiM9]AKE44794.1 hypothetical protein Sm_phiM9_166 [Sinorhizobium phage phiM9]